MRRETFQRLLPVALSIIPIAVAAVGPVHTSAAASLALPSRDYPRGTRITVPPATNDLVNRYFGPAHRSTFGALHRIDGLGWLQIGTWHFKTGRGALVHQHLTTFGYGINIFRNARDATRAIKDVRLKLKPHRLGHLWGHIFRSSDARQTIDFVFFTYHSVEVEAYFEYNGAAPAGRTRSLRHRFSTQQSHLAHYARQVQTALHATATPSATATSSPTSTATETGTATAPPAPTLTATPTPTSTPAPSPTLTQTATANPTATTVLTDTPTPEPTATPRFSVLTVTATMTSDRYLIGRAATVQATVTQGGNPVQGARIVATFQFPSGQQTCTALSDGSGTGVCQVLVPTTVPDGTSVEVDVAATGADGYQGWATTSFVVVTRPQ